MVIYIMVKFIFKYAFCTKKFTIKAGTVKKVPFIWDETMNHRHDTLKVP